MPSCAQTHSIAYRIHSCAQTDEDTPRYATSYPPPYQRRPFTHERASTHAKAYSHEEKTAYAHRHKNIRTSAHTLLNTRDAHAYTHTATVCMLLHAWPRYRGACSAACVVSYLHTSSCACICSSVDTHRRRGGAKRRGAQRRGARMPACIRAQAHKHTSIRAYKHIHVSAHEMLMRTASALPHVCAYACMRVCVYACLRVCVYACMRVCVFLNIRVCGYANIRDCGYACMHGTVPA
jgi:hypothetical protein